ncbi:hypothetical protein AVEN_29982-1 [Araneus ventricosus]|uniref:Uncharacterized protein n=1 Tax=Araneus ventricosus TaxID=182803 RepID=A0A4Y2VGS1_ARAVE|nr:hypothetical protein AVEN_29982-1 [Araneus ventricosus]
MLFNIPIRCRETSLYGDSTVLLFLIVTMVVEAFVPSVNQSIETGIDEGPLNDLFLNFGHRFQNGDLPGASSTVRRDENHLVRDPSYREGVPKHSIRNAISNRV